MSIFFRLKRKLCWKLFSRLPKTKNKAVLQSFYGRGYSDSPKAIAQELLRRGGYRVFWVVKDENAAKSLPPGITALRDGSVRSIWHQCTAAFWVDCCRKLSFTEKGDGQYYIQTWHGFPLKRIEADAGDALPPDYIASAQKDSRMCDLFLSNSRFLTEIYRKGFWYDGAVLECGFPRNDVLLKGDTQAGDRVRQTLDVPGDAKLLLYAPTFRKDMGLACYDIDYEALTSALGERFGGKWVILARLHPNMAAKAAELGLGEHGVRNASDYPDIQELYLASDGMVTDYSSVMFDYMLTGKPCFLYVNDLQSYKDDRNFYFDIGALPFALSETNEQLRQSVRDFELEAQRERVTEFCEAFGIAESGEAAKRAVDKMEEMRGQKA